MPPEPTGRQHVTAGQADEAVRNYNLARLECLLGNLDAAKMHLKAAFELDWSFRLIAFEDKDLQPLWSTLEQ